MKLTILGVPMSKQSARFRIVKKNNGEQFISSYQKKEIKDNEVNVRYAVQQQLPKDFIPFKDIALKVDLLCVYPPLKSFNKKKMQMLENGEVIYKISKPDRDNIAKIMMDNLNGVVYYDDSIVAAGDITKIYGLVPRTEITITTLNEQTI